MASPQEDPIRVRVRVRFSKYGLPSSRSRPCILQHPPLLLTLNRTLGKTHNYSAPEMDPAWAGVNFVDPNADGLESDLDETAGEHACSDELHEAVHCVVPAGTVAGTVVSESELSGAPDEGIKEMDLLGSDDESEWGSSEHDEFEGGSASYRSIIGL